jgi:hypothetical protein
MPSYQRQVSQLAGGNQLNLQKIGFTYLGHRCFALFVLNGLQQELWERFDRSLANISEFNIPFIKFFQRLS